MLKWVKTISFDFICAYSFVSSSLDKKFEQQES